MGHVQTISDRKDYSCRSLEMKSISMIHQHRLDHNNIINSHILLLLLISITITRNRVWGDLDQYFLLSLITSGLMLCVYMWDQRTFAWNEPFLFVTFFFFLLNHLHEKFCCIFLHRRRWFSSSWTILLRKDWYVQKLHCLLTCQMGSDHRATNLTTWRHCVYAINQIISF